MMDQEIVNLIEEEGLAGTPEEIADFLNAPHESGTVPQPLYASEVLDPAVISPESLAKIVDKPALFTEFKADLDAQNFVGMRVWTVLFERMALITPEEKTAFSALLDRTMPDTRSLAQRRGLGFVGAEQVRHSLLEN